MSFTVSLAKIKLGTNFLSNVKLSLYLHVFKRPIRNRVVVTGLGVVCSVGSNVPTAWNNVLKGVSGINKLGPEYDKLPCRIGALVDENKINSFEMVNNLNIASRSTKYLLIAVAEALTDSRIDIKEEVTLESTGVSIGGPYLNFSELGKACDDFVKTGHENFDSFVLPRALLHTSAVLISNKYKLRGPILSQTWGSATGLMAIGEAYRCLKYHPNIEVMICGSAEASISPFVLGVLSNFNILSTKYNDTPEKACRPFDKHRDGSVLGEGAGVLILETLEHAIKRQALIYCEILGYGASSNRSHIIDMSTSKRNPDSTIRSMILALSDAQIHPDAVSYINANASSSVDIDHAEATAIQKLFGDRSWELFVSSTKGAHGNLLAASGSVEMVFTCMAIFSGKLPPTLNNNMHESEYHLNFITELNTEYYSRRKIVLKNSISIWTLSASLCLTHFNE